MIKVNSVTKRFENFTAINDVSFNIPSGCIYGMVGSNGAGKSTLIRLLTGIYRPEAGSITIDDIPVYENPVIKKDMAFVPDDLYFLGNANINTMAGFYKNYYPSFDMERCSELADAFRLDKKRNIHTFSKGMKRQAAIILALSIRPKYYFFDETFDGLDPVMRNLVKSLICDDVYEKNATAIITSHSLRELEDTCDQLALFHQGGMIFESDIQDIKTSLFKIQIAFKEPKEKEAFNGLNILHYNKVGSVHSLIVRGDRDDSVRMLNALEPILLDVVPLSLEEVFTYETELLGYSFENVLEVK